MKLHQVSVVLVAAFGVVSVASAQSRLIGDEFTISGGNLPNSFGVTVDPETQEATDHGPPAATVVFDGTTQAAGGMMVTPTVTEWPGLPGGIPAVQAAGINIDDMVVNDVLLTDWENVGEVVQFSYETTNGGYMSQDNDVGQSFATVRGLDWADSAPGATPGFFEQGFYFYWSNQGMPLTNMATLMPEIGLFVGAHPTDPGVPEVTYIGYSSGQVEDVVEVYAGGTDVYTGTTQLGPDASWDALMQVMNLPIFGENAEGVPADGIHIGFLVVPPEAAASEQVCGDFDMDGDVDSADRTIQTTNWTGALPPGDPNATKTFAQGDCDADGDVDTADQNGTITNWTGAMNLAGNLEDGGDANLIYDPATGNVKLDAADAASGMFISFVLGTGDNNMRPENLVESAPGNAGPFFDVGTNTDATTFQIGQTDPLNQGAGPVIDLGDVFPAGITSKEALAEYLTLAEYASELGSGGTFDLELVPEPTGFVLALLAMTGLMSRRRR